MYVVVDTHTGLTVSAKFARRARAQAIAARKNNKAVKDGGPIFPAQYVVQFLRQG